MIQADVFAERVAYHAEGPLWWPGGRLTMADGYAGDLVELDPATGGELGRTRLGAYLGPVRPRRAGGLVAGVSRGFVLGDADGHSSALPELWHDPQLRMNEGACDWLGRFYSGRLREDEPREGYGALYRLADPDQPAVPVLKGVGICNGLVFDADQGCAYFVDTLTRTVQRFDDVDSDAPWSAPSIAVDLRGLESYPDGLTMDAEGNLWVALWGAGQVHCYRPGTSELLEVVSVPEAHHTTSMVFGGDDLSTLYITASAQGEGAGRLAGSMFRAVPGAVGVLPYEYGW